MAVRAGLAMNCTIGVQNRFARKNYFYPDLPKGYQISQYEAPICEHGWIEIAVGGSRKRVRIRRAHLEEDAGKNLHEAGSGMQPGGSESRRDAAAGNCDGTGHELVRRGGRVPQGACANS